MEKSIHHITDHIATLLDVQGWRAEVSIIHDSFKAFAELTLSGGL